MATVVVAAQPSRNRGALGIKLCMGFSIVLITIDSLLTRYFPDFLPLYLQYRNLIPLSNIGIFRYILLFLNIFAARNYTFLYRTPATLLFGIIALSFELGYVSSGGDYYRYLVLPKEISAGKQYYTGVGIKGGSDWTEIVQIILYLVPLLWVLRSEYQDYPPSGVSPVSTSGDTPGGGPQGRTGKRDKKRKAVNTDKVGEGAPAGSNTQDPKPVRTGDKSKDINTDNIGEGVPAGSNTQDPKPVRTGDKSKDINTDNIGEGVPAGSNTQDPNTIMTEPLEFGGVLPTLLFSGDGGIYHIRPKADGTQPLRPPVPPAIEENLPTLLFSSTGEIHYIYPKAYNELLEKEGKTLQGILDEAVATEAAKADSKPEKPEERKKEKVGPSILKMSDLEGISYPANPVEWRDSSRRAQGLSKNEVNPIQEHQALSIFGPDGKFTTFKDEKKLEKELAKRFHVMHNTNVQREPQKAKVPVRTIVYGPIEGQEVTQFDHPDQIKAILESQIPPLLQRDDRDDIPPITVLSPAPYAPVTEITKRSQVGKAVPDSPPRPISPILVFGPTTEEPIPITTEQQLTSTLNMDQIRASLIEKAKIEEEERRARGLPLPERLKPFPREAMIYGPGEQITYFNAERDQVGSLLNPVTEEERHLGNATEEEINALLEQSQAMPGTLVFGLNPKMPIQYISSGFQQIPNVPEEEPDIQDGLFDLNWEVIERVEREKVVRDTIAKARKFSPYKEPPIFETNIQSPEKRRTEEEKPPIPDPEFVLPEQQEAEPERKTVLPIPPINFEPPPPLPRKGSMTELRRRSISLLDKVSSVISSAGDDDIRDLHRRSRMYFG